MACSARSDRPAQRHAEPAQPRCAGSTEVPDIRATSLYLNRELSWLEFNARVLAEADSESVPLLERLKFHAIVASNLDEFFMVRVAGLKQQLTGEVDEIGPEGMTVGEQLAAICDARARAGGGAVARASRRCCRELAEAGIVFLKPSRALGRRRSRTWTRASATRSSPSSRRSRSTRATRSPRCETGA